MKDVKERLAAVEQVAASAHKRDDKQDAELDRLRDKNHGHSNLLQRHDGMLDAHTEIFKDVKGALNALTIAQTNNTETLISFKAMAIAALFMGGGFITFCGFVGGKFLHWW